MQEEHKQFPCICSTNVCRIPSVCAPQASQPWWITARSAVCDGRAPPVRPFSLGSACVKGDKGREASLRSRQHHAQVPEGVAPTQLSLPVTCIHQLPPGSGCHHSTALPLPLPRPGSCPGYPSLTPLSQVFYFIFPHLFLSHNGISRVISLSMEEGSFSFPCQT